LRASVIDPVPPWVLRAALSLLFGTAAAHKLRDVGSFRRALEGYQLLPPLWAVPAGAALIAVELGVALAFWLPPLSASAAMAAAALLLVYAGAMAVNLRRGRRDVDCGCFGPARRRPISSTLVARNVALAAAALTVALPVQPRALIWIDAVTITAGVLLLALLYAAIDGLLVVSADAVGSPFPLAEAAHD